VTRVTRALAVCLALALAACNSIEVKQDWDPSESFGSLRTWAWQSQTPAVSGDPRVDDPLVHSRIQTAIESALTQKGLAKSSGKPDVLVAYHIALQQKLDARTIYTGYGPYRGWYGVGGTETVVDTYDLGTLLIDFVSPQSNNVIWRGTGQSRIQELRTPEERQARIQDAVDRILGQFPPPPKK